MLFLFLSFQPYPVLLNLKYIFKMFLLSVLLGFKITFYCYFSCFPFCAHTLSIIFDTKKKTQWSSISDHRSSSLPSQIVSAHGLHSTNHKTLWLRGRATATATAAGACLAARMKGPNVSPVISAASSHAFAFLKRAGDLIGSESVIMNIVCSKQTVLLDCWQMAGSKMPIIRWGNF